MAEYKKFSCPHGDDFEGGDECDRCEQYELCMETPTADVIERSKIDNAIKEMESVELVMFCDEMRDYCVEILKRNIGE